MDISDLENSITSDWTSHLLEHILGIHKYELEGAVNVDVCRLATDKLEMRLILNLCVANSTCLVGLRVDHNLRCHELIPLHLLCSCACFVNWLRTLLLEREDWDFLLNVVRKSLEKRMFEHQRFEWESLCLEKVWVASCSLKCGWKWLFSGNCR